MAVRAWEVIGLPARIKQWLAAVFVFFWLMAPVAVAAEPIQADPVDTGQPFVDQVSSSGNGLRRVTILDVLLVTLGMATGLMLPKHIQRWRHRRGRGGPENQH